MTADILSCSCCGAGVRDNAEENASHGEVPYPHDTGYGMCRGCGGDPKAKTAKKRMGWASAMFYEARIGILSEKLTGDNRESFMEKSFVGKCNIIGKMIERGHMI